MLAGDQLRLDESSLAQYGQDWLGLYAPNPGGLALPKTAGEVQELVRWANRHSVPLVPSGGRTGLSGGATATGGELLVSLEKMNQILDFDESDATVLCQAGVVTARLQDFAESKGLFYPVDFASSGSSQLGGNIATNAGGIRVIRYGMTRDWVAGLKVVTGSGELLDLGKALKKNATGYDLRHLFIGSEGTLGLVVEAEMQLTQKPPPQQVLLFALPRLQEVMQLLEAFRRRLVISAFEFFSDAALTRVMEAHDLPSPFSDRAAFYVLLEVDQPEDDELLPRLFEMALEKGWVQDGVLSQSLDQMQRLWQYREFISESITRYLPYKNDVAVRIAKVPEFLDAVSRLLGRVHPDFEVIWFGHIGDGNLHLNLLKPGDWSSDDFKQECEAVSRLVFAEVQRFSGSISAEHGVGLLKKQHLHYSRSSGEISLMRGIRRVFDPNGLLNPGKLLD